MRVKGHIIIILLLLFCSIGSAVAQKKNTLIITEDHLVLQLDLNSTAKEIDSILKIAGIGGSISGRVLKGDFTAINKDGWYTAAQQDNIVQFDLSLAVLNENPQSRPFMITTRLPNFGGEPGYPGDVIYGVNKFAKVTVYELSSGLTRFILPGYSQAKRVFLSGSFNNWSTLKGLMKKNDGGWMIDLKLEPGAYEYKYIIDGRWATDPNNLLQVDGGGGNFNSVYYKYNYTFKLQGYGSAHRITVAGDFNKWNAGELTMKKNGNTWERSLYLNDGMHIYRFKVDGQWVVDPVNPAKLKDATSKLNSVLNLGEPVYFKLQGYSGARNVFVAGDFNQWKPGELSLKRAGDSWVLPFKLSPGNYYYKFIVDGRWITDPQNPHYSPGNSDHNSFLAVKPNHTFKLKGFSDAKTVTISGGFNNWDTNGYTLAHIGDEWTIDFHLKPGKFLYKFRVDGKWILDPGNKLWEQNEFNTGNSVLWIE